MVKPNSYVEQDADSSKFSAADGAASDWKPLRFTTVKFKSSNGNSDDPDDYSAGQLSEEYGMNDNGAVANDLNYLDAKDDSQLVEDARSSTVPQDMPDMPMPSNDVIIQEFEEYLELHSPLSDEEEATLRKLSIEERWNKLLKQGRHVAVFSAKQYVEGLLPFAESSYRKSGSLQRIAINNATKCSYWLKKLKTDLKRSHDSLVEEFVQKPNNGLSLLVSVLKKILREQEKVHSLKKRQVEHLKSSLWEQYDCLLCIKFCLKSKSAVTALLECIGVVWDITLCLMSNFTKICLAVIQILTLICEERQGFLLVSDAITLLKVKSMENVRFKLICSMLHSKDNCHFQAVCIRFFNKFLSCTDDANAKVFLQHELKQAGFDPDSLDKYSLRNNVEYIELQKEIDIWHKNYINVDKERDELYQQQNRGSMLRNEIDRLQAKLKENEEALEKEKKLKVEVEMRFDKLREKAAEIQDMLGRVAELFKEQVGHELSEDIPDLENLYKPLEGYGILKDKFGTLSSSKSQSVSSLEQAIQPPPAPPVMPPHYLSNTLRRKVGTHVNMPLLNWVPMYSVRNTLFEDIDDEAKLRDIDFSDFEQLFQLPNKEVESRNRGDRIVQRSAKLVTCIETSKARNMIITIKKTGLSYVELKEAIESFQLDKLSGEYAELLLKYVPIKEELKCLAANAHHYNQMGEAEKYLFQMTKVERLDRKLSLMAFMGRFDDVIKSLSPEMEMIQRTSESLMKSLKLKKVFELVLAFGNYMNSMKKGYAVGFKLESLSKLQEVKSGDKRQTFLHYLAHFIENKYPELINFADELDISVEKGVSYQSIASDVLGLRRGMDLLKLEMEKQPSNKILTNFHAAASLRVMETADRFRRMEETYKNVCTYFGEDYRKVEPDELVKHITDFVTSFKRATEDNHHADQPHDPSPTKAHKRHESTSCQKGTMTDTPIREKIQSTRSVDEQIASNEEISNVKAFLHEKETRVLKSLDINGKYAYNTAEKGTQVQEDSSENSTDSVKSSRHISRIKVMEGKSYAKLGTGEYSELPIATVQNFDQFSVQIHDSTTKEKDIHLARSHSFFYGAKVSDREPKINKSPSFNAKSSQNHGSGNLKHTPTPPPRRKVNISNDASVYSGPVHEHVKAECLSDEAPITDVQNGLEKSYSETDSVTTNSSLSLLTQSTGPNDTTSTKNHHAEDTNDNVTDNDSLHSAGRVSLDQNMSFYKREVNDVIDSLDQLLDDEYADGPIAAEDESSYL